MAAKETKYYRKHTAKVLEIQRQYRIRIRLEVLRHYACSEEPFCACCGESNYEFLSIDHMGGGGTKHRQKVGPVMFLWLRRNNYPKGFRVLCHNCNSALGYYGYCPHNN